MTSVELLNVMFDNAKEALVALDGHYTKKNVMKIMQIVYEYHTYDANSFLDIEDVELQRLYDSYIANAFELGRDDKLRNHFINVTHHIPARIQHKLR